MKNKVVAWGTNDKNEKILMALQLKETDSKVLVYVIPEPIASEDFITKLNTVWRDQDKDIDFPEGHTVITRELSVADSILPDELKADRPESISRAQSEWHFVVLSGKLYAVYQQELDDLKEKVKSLTQYDNGVWNTLKAFWDKVTEQSREKNLFRAHSNTLRDSANELFEELKTIRKVADTEFSDASAKILEEINEKLAEIEARIEKGGNKIHLVFEDLKNLQSKYSSAKLTNVHRGKAFERIDAAFKTAKARRFGAEANEGSIVERHTRRLKGLVEAIDRMRDSANRDEKDLEFQRKKVATTEGQLEAQIRQAKMKMIEERLASKKERIADMEKTKADIERQIASANDREEKRTRMDAAKANAKSEIDAITTKSAPKPEGDDTSAPEARGSRPSKADLASTTTNVAATTSVMDVLVNALGETLESASETLKAVKEVVAEKMEDAIDTAMEVAADVAGVADKHSKTEEAPAAEAVASHDEVETHHSASAPAAEVQTEAATPAAEPEAVVEAAEEAIAEAPAAAEEAKDEAPAAEDEAPKA